MDTFSPSPAPASPETYDAATFPRPSVTVDIALFTVRERRLHVLLIQRGAWPFQGQWALPGGFVRQGETLDEAACRELAEETGLDRVLLEQLRAFGGPGRDPRTWVITIAYTALVGGDAPIPRADTDAADARWFPADALPGPLAFDHDAILDHALASLRGRLNADLAVAAALLPARFTLSALQEAYESLLARPLDKRNFRKWALAAGGLAPTGDAQRGRHRPALLYEYRPVPSPL